MRIRPTPSDSDASVARPYLEMQGDKDVLMRAPVVSYGPSLMFTRYSRLTNRTPTDPICPNHLTSTRSTGFLVRTLLNQISSQTPPYHLLTSYSKAKTVSFSLMESVTAARHTLSRVGIPSTVPIEVYCQGLSMWYSIRSLD